MNFQTPAIEMAGVLLSHVANNTQIWIDAKMFAKDLMAKDIPGKQKHEKIKADLFMLFKEDLAPLLEEIAGALLDVLIKLAFIYVKTQVKNDNK